MKLTFATDWKRLIPSTRSACWLLAAQALVVLLVGYVVFMHFANQIENETHASLKVIALTKKNHIESFLAERKADAEILARRPAVWQNLQAKNGPIRNEVVWQRLKLAIQQTAIAYGYNDVRLLDRSLNTVFAIMAAPISPDERAVFERVLRTRTSAIVDFHFLPDQSTVFGIACPVFEDGNPKAAPIGVVYLEVNSASALEPLVFGWPIVSSSAEVVLFKREQGDKVYLSRLRFDPDAPHPWFHRVAIRDTVLAGRQHLNSTEPTLFSDTDYRDVTVITAGVAIAGTPWYLEAKLDHAEATHAVRQLGWGIALISVVFLLLLLLLVRLLWRARNADLVASRAEQDARHMAARKASIDGYVLIDDAGRIIEANEAMARLSGYSCEALCEKSIGDLNPDFAPEVFKTEYEKLRASTGARIRTQLWREDKSRLDIEISVNYLPAPDGGTLHAFIHDITQELAAQRSIERLNAFYLFLSHANAVIFNLHSIETVLEAVCERAVRDGGFLLAWAGLLDEEATHIIPVTASGAAAEYARQLFITTNPALPTSHGPTRACMVEQRVIHTDDFQHDNRTTPWHGLAREYGLNASASVPILVGDKACAVLNFYSGEKNHFSQDVRALLEEVARNVSLAWQAMVAEEQRKLALDKRDESERRFARGFDAAAVPVQIMSATSRKMRAINRAYERTFGYALADIPDEAAWLERIFPNAEFRQLMTEQWRQDVARVLAGSADSVVRSELSLRCKDGGERIVRGFMSAAGDDIFVQWLDLTEIKRAEAELIENERRFRGMIEQTLTGIYVTQDSRIVYVNPRLCEIVGWSKDDLLGRDSLEFFAHTPETQQTVVEARARLASGVRSVSLSIPFMCKDGKAIILGIHASLGVWNGHPAIIVMSQDITERQHAEQRIAAYVKQLEGTMQGTLQAVARMVDLRDPYTAGHQKNVGIIAADIAREMGWAEERCHSLQLIGLVHDIGKIAVPAEILSKPGRLTPLEFEMVQAHAEKGYEILKDVEFSLPIAEIIREHHERMDGSGYPRQLKGAAILPEARVLAVADVLESMASHRPYRPALGIDAALREIETHRGTWFDEAVVDAMLRLIRDKGYQLPC